MDRRNEVAEQGVRGGTGGEADAFLCSMREECSSGSKLREEMGRGQTRNGEVSNGCKGLEPFPIPVTNDVDDQPAPTIEYIIHRRYRGIHPSTHWSPAPPCKGCPKNLTDPEAPLSEHAMHWLKDLPGCTLYELRHRDEREDWQGEKMYGRLPYDRFGRLLLAERQDVVECNSRCPCGTDCPNRGIQKGLQKRLEVFKTPDKGWAVRTLERIYRGEFVSAYVGEVLSDAEARKRGEAQDEQRLSFLFNIDAPGVAEEDMLVIDGYHASNVARFINHSCEGNMAVFRVYVDTLESRYAQLALFAICEIEVGTELSYDYEYNVSTPEDTKHGHKESIPCRCKAEKCRQWLWNPPDIS